MIGGSGEKKTLRLVAQYADARSISRPVDLSRELDVLRANCADVGRDHDTIQKTAVTSFELARRVRGRTDARALV
jgi:alkanesulfonate monooxygenase